MLIDRQLAETTAWTPERIEALFSRDVHELGALADAINRDQGNIATYVINRHINYSNICVSRCPLCAFYRDEGDDDAYTMSVDDVLAKASEAVDAGATELHIVGSLNPSMTLAYFEELFGAIRRTHPDTIIKALTATEIAFMARRENSTITAVLERLKRAGLQAMPGGGAEILDDAIRAVICPGKVSADEWLSVMEAAHGLGIATNATMLFGHIETLQQRALHLYKLWRLQEKTGGFVSFIPLVFYPRNTKLAETYGIADPTNALDVLRTIAVARIVLRNFKSIRAYWVALGESLAQVGLNYGANDIDGTIMEERVTHAAGAETPRMLQTERLEKLIRGAGKIPAERDTFYTLLRRADGTETG